MFKFLRRRANHHDDNISDIVQETTSINISDSAPILNRNFDLTNNSDSLSFHDLRRSNQGDDVNLIKRSLRTIPGVFCPVALSMSSVAVFMRVGFIVGHAGILDSLGLYALAFTIFVLTGLSICAISTNGAIQGGGVYYMISRTLGPEIGGSIGALFFIANAIASAFNATGLVEAILNNFGTSKVEGGLPESFGFRVLYGSVLNTFTLVICLLGSNLFSFAISFIYLIMLIVYLCVIFSIFLRGPFEIPLPGLSSNATGYFTGLSSQTFRDNLYSNYTADYKTGSSTNFAYVFGILFSSMTGIMAGANMSGELKKPSKSIPLGTMSAVLFVFVVYFSQNLLLAGSCERIVLVNNNQVLQSIVFWEALIPIGIVATTFSGELSAAIGSSRVLKALADDEIFGSLLKFVKYGKTKSGNPWVAVVVSFIISECVLLIGSVNSIAQLVTIFYLLAYFGVNLACMALDLASAPNFRPSFKYFTWQTALLGMIGSIIMTFIVSVEYASIAIGLLISLLTVLYFRDFPPEWGSISQALIFHQVRKYLLLLDTRKDHVKFWRPQIILLISNPRSCIPLIDFGNDVKKGGLFVLGNVKVGKFDDFEEDPCTKEMPSWMNLVDTLKVKAFIELTLNSSVKEGIHNLIRISGLGGMKPNTVMMGFYDNSMPEDLLKHRPLTKRRNILQYGMTNPLNANGGSTIPMSFFENLRTSNDENRLDLNSYVDLIRDVLKMKKNLCLCRQFSTLNKENLRQKSNPIYIDVWPLNFLIPESCIQLDSTSLFMLQLACILNMVSVWKKATLRVYLCSDNSDNVENMRRKARLDDLLNQLRIQAMTTLIPMQHVRDLLNRPIITESDLPHYQQSGTSHEILNVSDIYLKAANQLIKQHSDNASICYLYLPPPPFFKKPQIPENARLNNSAFNASSSSSNLMQEQYTVENDIDITQTTAFINTTQDTNSENNTKYMRILEQLSDSLPPCVFVNGVSCVTSTHL